MFITDEEHHKNPILANLSCDEKSICIPLPNKICNSAILVREKMPTSLMYSPIDKLKSNPPISNIRGSGAFRDGQQ